MGEIWRQTPGTQDLFRGLDDRTIGILIFAGSFPLLLMLFPRWCGRLSNFCGLLLFHSVLLPESLLKSEPPQCRKI